MDTIYVLRQVELNERNRPSIMLAASENLETLKTYALEYEGELQQLETEEEEIRLAGEVEWLTDPAAPPRLFWRLASMPDVEYEIAPVHVV